jgi:hypothetical protein
VRLREQGMSWRGIAAEVERADDDGDGVVPVSGNLPITPPYVHDARAASNLLDCEAVNAVLYP